MIHNLLGTAGSPAKTRRGGGVVYLSTLLAVPAIRTMLLMLRPNLADDRFVENKLTERIARHRWLFFAFLLLLYAISFNGQWRPGQDSAIYRGIAANLASGKGYVFGEWATHQAYPGLPVLLAGVQTVFGIPLEDLRAQGAFAFIGRRVDTTASIILILSMSLLTLVVTYRLIRMHYPQWVAVCVTFGVGINSWFLQLSHELLTDVPFLLGVVLALYGWERLKRSQDATGGAGALGLIVAGLLLAGSMRPMFWVVGVAWIIVCTWALVRNERRAFHAISLLVLLITWSILVLVDPRTPTGFNPFAGGYEREVLDLLPEAHVTLTQRLYQALREELPTAFFGEQMSPLGIFFSLLVLGSCVLLFRRHPLWAWMVFIAFGVTLIASAEARYYIMVLPMLLLGWLLMLGWLLQRVPPRWSAAVLFVGLGIVTAPNITGSISFIREQRMTPFIEHYKHGRYVTLFRMCDLIRERVGNEERVLGPLASIMRYVSGKNVLSQRELLAGANVLHYPQALYDARLNYAVFPSSIYRTKEPFVARLMERNILFSIRRIGYADNWYLARVRVRIPDVPDWRDLPRGWSPDHPAPADVKPPPAAPRKGPAPATRPIKKSPPQDRRAMTMILSPRLFEANGAPASAV